MANLLSDDPFFSTAKRLALQLLKNAERVPPELLTVVQSFEKGEWQRLPDREKLGRLDRLRQAIDGQDSTTKHFQNYPHAWSRNLFASFNEQLDACRKELAPPR